MGNKKEDWINKWKGEKKASWNDKQKDESNKIKSKEGQKDKGPIRKAYNRNLRDNSGLFRPIFKTRG